MNRPGRSFTFLLGIVTTILLGWVLHVGAGILQPLVIALLLTNILQPLVRRLSRWHIPPPVTVLLLTVLLFFGLAQAGMLLQANLGNFFSGDDPQDPFQERILSDENAGQVEVAAPPPSEAESGWPAVVQAVNDRMSRSNAPAGVVSVVTNALNQVDPDKLSATLIGSGIGFTRSLVLVLVYMIFIFAEQTVFKGKILSVAGARRDDASRVLDTIAIGVQRYLSVKTLISLLTGALAYLLLVLFGVEFALLFGLLTFLLNYIPTFGSILAGVFASIYTLTAHSWTVVAAIAVGYLAINVILGNFIEPRILGRELNLSPLVIVISVVAWAGIWGVVGAFLAVPLTASAQIILATQERTRAIAVMLSSRLPPEESPGQ